MQYMHEETTVCMDLAERSLSLHSNFTGVARKELTMDQLFLTDNINIYSNGKVYQSRSTK